MSNQDEQTRYQKSIDWITCTTIHRFPEHSLLPPNSFIALGERTTFPRFEFAYKLEPAGTLAINGKFSSGLLNLTGKDINAWRASIQDQSIMDYLTREVNNRFTRIDYAIDCLGLDVTEEFSRLILSDGVTRVKEITAFHALRGQGYTCYVGSKGSDLRVRVYDKAAELGLLWQAWTRIEMQCRGKKARALSTDISKHGIAKAGSSHLAKFIELPDVNWWHIALSDQGIIPQSVSNHDADWEKWMNTSVVSSILRRKSTHKRFIEEWLMGLIGELHHGE